VTVNRQNRDDEKYLPKCPNSTHVARATNSYKSKLPQEKCSSLGRMHHWLFMGHHLSSAPKTRDAFLSTHCRQLTSKAVS